MRLVLGVGGSGVLTFVRMWRFGFVLTNGVGRLVGCLRVRGGVGRLRVLGCGGVVEGLVRWGGGFGV